MTDEELRVRAIQELEFYKKDDTFMLADITVDLAIEALEQLPSVNPQPCEDVINRQAVTDTTICDGISCNECSFNTCEDGQAGCLLKERVDKLPSVTLQPKTGHWIWCIGSHKCSNCEEYTCFSHKELLRYCPNCGAKMVEPQERSDNE